MHAPYRHAALAALAVSTCALAACSLDREPAQSGATRDGDPLSCGIGAACVRSTECSCLGGVGVGTGGSSGGGATGDTGGMQPSPGTGGNQPIDGAGGMMVGSGGVIDGSGGAMDGSGGAMPPTYPTANPLNVTPGATQGSCPAGFRCSDTVGFGTVCTELDGSSRVCAMNPDCANYGPDAICQFTPTFQAYCFQTCTP